MSPTSYQAAPPRVDGPNIAVARTPVKGDSLPSQAPLEMSPALAGTIASRSTLVAIAPRLREAIQDLPIATHEPELLARYPLLHHRIALDRLLHLLQ